MTGHNTEPLPEPGAPRPVTAYDIALLAELHAAIFTATWDQPWTAESLRQILAMPGTRGWLLERESMPVGFVLARFTLDEGEILLTGVLPAYRNRGYGRRLMETAIAAARAAGVTRLFLEHAEQNFEAAALYRKLGCKTVGRRRGYYATKVGVAYDAITLILDLGDAGSAGLAQSNGQQ